MSLSFVESFDVFKVTVLPFLSIFIPLVLSYWAAKKTNVAVGLMTIVLYVTLITKFAADIGGVSENLANILETGVGKYLAPIYQMFYGFVLFIGDVTGLGQTLLELDSLILVGAVWALFLILAILGNLFSPLKIVSNILVWIFAIILIVVLFMAVFSKDPITSEYLSIILNL